jgi:hypothetical protein
MEPLLAFYGRSGSVADPRTLHRGGDPAALY